MSTALAQGFEQPAARQVQGITAAVVQFAGLHAVGSQAAVVVPYLRTEAAPLPRMRCRLPPRLPLQPRGRYRIPHRDRSLRPVYHNPTVGLGSSSVMRSNHATELGQLTESKAAVCKPPLGGRSIAPSFLKWRVVSCGGSTGGAAARPGPPLFQEPCHLHGTEVRLEAVVTSQMSAR